MKQNKISKSLKTDAKSLRSLGEGGQKSNNRPSVSIIILNYNAAAFLPKTLNSIMKQKGITHETIVVDNNSSDNSLALLTKDYPWVKVIKRHTLVGFAAGNNAGLSVASGKTILFFNPDIAFTNSTDLKKCFDKYYSLPGIGLLTARVNLIVNGQIDQTCHRGFPTPWNAFCHFSGLEKLFPNCPLTTGYTLQTLGYDTEHEVGAIGGMFMFMSRKLGEEIGWWDEKYPLYGEDLDFSYRVAEKGYHNLYYPAVVVKHYKGATTGMNKNNKKATSASKSTTKRVKNWSIQAMEIFYRKHYAKKYPFLVNWLVFLGIKVVYLKRVVFA